MASKLKINTKILDTSVHQLTCAFKGYSGHKGVDIIPKSTSETPSVLAFADGTVVAVGNVSGTNKSTGIQGCGTYVAVEHNDGIITRYQHGKYNSLKVAKGQKVKKGQELMLYGRPTTGNSTGCHLHFDISFVKSTDENAIVGTFLNKTRYYVDPLPYLSGDKTIAKEDKRKVTCLSGLNIRVSPNGRIVGELQYGEIVSILEEDGKWAKIGKNKWVYSPYLEVLYE